MKKHFIIALFLLITFFSAPAQKRWGIADGIGLNRVSGYNALGIKTDVLVTLQASVFGILPLDKNDKFVFMPSLGYLPKGVQFKNVLFTDNLGNVIGTGNSKRRIDYLQLTLPGSLKMKWSKKVEGYIGTGPYIAYGLSGKEKWNYNTGGNNTSTSVKLDFDKASINRFEIGFNAQFSVIVSGNWLFGLSSDIAITKINSAGTNNTYNQASHVNIGYVF
ncbi:MAG: outer membrane beta-barrel protein [Bacteroidota bacterium]